jgi:hypothetical protein
MAWHLYEDPVIPESAIEASNRGSQQQRQGPPSDDLDDLRDYVWNKCGNLMQRVTSLTEQHWGHRNVIKYGAPKLKAVTARSTHRPIGYEWDICNFVKEIEKEFLSRLYNQFLRARTALQSCEKIYRCLDPICV